jgi:hypothetical protein
LKCPTGKTVTISPKNVKVEAVVTRFLGKRVLIWEEVRTCCLVFDPKDTEIVCFEKLETVKISLEHDGLMHLGFSAAHDEMQHKSTTIAGWIALMKSCH